MRKWWNWYTRTFEGRMPYGLRVRVPPCAPKNSVFRIRLTVFGIPLGRRIPSIERAAKIAKKLHAPVETWVALALSDMMSEAHLDLKVDVKKKASGF